MDRLNQGLVVVDFEPGVRTHLADILQVPIRAAETAEIALDMLCDAELPALLITRQQLPGMSGIELLTLVRSRYPELPLLLIVTCCPQEIKEQAAVAGIVVGSPLDPDYLLGKIAEAMGPMQPLLPFGLQEEKKPQTIEQHLEDIMIKLSTFGQRGTVTITPEMRTALEQAIRRFGSARAIADLVGVGEPALSRWRNDATISIRHLRLLYPFIAGYLPQSEKDRLAPRVIGVLEQFVASFCG